MVSTKYVIDLLFFHSLVRIFDDENPDRKILTAKRVQSKIPTQAVEWWQMHLSFIHSKYFFLLLVLLAMFLNWDFHSTPFHLSFMTAWHLCSINISIINLNIRSRAKLSTSNILSGKSWLKIICPIDNSHPNNLEYIKIELNLDKKKSDQWQRANVFLSRISSGDFWVGIFAVGILIVTHIV